MMKKVTVWDAATGEPIVFDFTIDARQAVELGFCVSMPPKSAAEENNGDGGSDVDRPSPPSLPPLPEVTDADPPPVRTDGPLPVTTFRPAPFNPETADRPHLFEWLRNHGKTVASATSTDNLRAAAREASSTGVINREVDTRK